MPAGATPELSKDPYGYPAVDIKVGGTIVTCQFDSGIGALGVTLAADPPTVYGMTVQASELAADHAAMRYLDSRGNVWSRGYAPGVMCGHRHLAGLPDVDLGAIFTVCASVRSPAPGVWREASAAQRANGGMTDVPDGAWVEPELPGTAGSAVLRPGRFTAEMHVGELVIRSTRCPASFEGLDNVSTPEVEAQVEHRAGATGDVWIRRAIEEHDGNRYPAPTRVVVPHGARCCLAHFVPWTRPVEAAKIDYAIALCGTFRER